MQENFLGTRGIMNFEKVWEKKPKTVLIVEDDEISFFVLKMLLSKHDYNIIHAWDGKEAVEIFKANDEVDLVLMDIQMPVMDGFSATREIRKLNDHVPVIVQSGFVMDWVKEKALSVGCNEIISKPVMPDILGNTVEKYLSKYTEPELKK